MNDELEKLGLRVRPRMLEPRVHRPGRQIAFDDRGNAVYDWGDERLIEAGEEADRARHRALDHPGLSIIEDEAANAPMHHNSKGVRVGYNPYESGLLPKKKGKKRRDLRELSKWLESKRRAIEQEPEE